jgi:hypothetical protein
MPRSPHLSTWTGHEIYEECRVVYSAYARAKTESYVAYFAAHPELRDEQHPYKARDLAAALPEEWAGLADYLPSAGRHQHHLSGNSSQTLALGLLGVGARLDPWLGWLWEALSSAASSLASRSVALAPQWQFEFTLAPGVLGEQPRQTSIDFVASDASALLCIECKWVEAGLGACSCPAPAPLTDTCSDRVLAREAYWTTAYEVFHLPEREVGKACPLSFTYQAVRTGAAALASARDGQLPVFGLLYDAENPYFAGCGDWPGWPTALAVTLPADESPVRFASVSWQELLPLLPLDDPAAFWASEKHGLHKEDPPESQPPADH